MNKLRQDLLKLIECDVNLARRILCKIESQIIYCKKYNYEIDPIKNIMLDFLMKLSANKFDKSRDKSQAFIKDGIMYLCDMCDL